MVWQPAPLTPRKRREGVFTPSPSCKRSPVCAQPVENKQASEEAGAEVKAKVIFLTRSPNGRDVKRASWQMGTLGGHRFVTLYKAPAEKPLRISPPSAREREREQPSQDFSSLLPPEREAGPSSRPPRPQEHPFPPGSRRVSAFLVKLRAQRSGESGAGQGLFIVPARSH